MRVSRRTGALSPKLNCPQIPHINDQLLTLFPIVFDTRRIPVKKKAKTPEVLRLRPAMHRNVVPTEQEFPAAKRPVGLLPVWGTQEAREDPIELRKAALQ